MKANKIEQVNNICKFLSKIVRATNILIKVVWHRSGARLEPPTLPSLLGKAKLVVELYLHLFL